MYFQRVRTVIETLIDQFVTKGKQLFLLDSLGAMLSAFFLGVVLTGLDTYFNMPTAILYLLALLACSFCAYSIICYFFTGRRWRVFLQGIAIVNSIYGCLTFWLVVFYSPSLTKFDICYFLIELIVLILLIFVELKAASYVQKT